MMRRVLLLGSTGSVGRSTLDVAASLPDRFRVDALAARSRAEALVDQARACGARTISLEDPEAAERARGLVAGSGIEVLGGPGAALELTRRADVDVIVQATVGAAALETTLAALERGVVVGLANKESLVVAGPLLLETTQRTGATLVPVDSEHSAIYQCLRSGRADEVERIYLTASGGSVRDRPLDTLADATPEEALNHPTWSMGPRITVDSATMMNKALEVVEAHVLFDLSPERIEVVQHPQSVIHSMVEFRDGSVMAQMSRPDMRLPVLFALAYPDRPHYDPVRFSLADYAELNLRAVDPERYPGLALGYRAAASGGVAGAVLNAADEEAVGLFLDGKIRFTEIVGHVRRVMDVLVPEGAPAEPATLETIRAADAAARKEVHAC
jgi:1-deoxy-D-xylulose-5-phosphate reductoisomerase